MAVVIEAMRTYFFQRAAAVYFAVAGQIPDRTQYRLVVYGDSRGDKELLAFSDESYYKQFNR